MSFTLMMQEIATLRFQRSVVPKIAMSCDINTIDAADGSNKDYNVLRYMQEFGRNGRNARNGTYSSQLLNCCKTMEQNKY